MRRRRIAALHSFRPVGRKLQITLFVLVAVLLVGAVGAYAWDSTRKDEIAEGVTIGGVNVAGMTEAQARKAVDAKLVEPLREPVTVTFEGVRYQLYESADGHVLFMASEQAFWKNFAEGIGRPELFERWPGSKYADHAKGNLELQAILKDVFKEKTSAAWLAFADEHNVPIAPVNNAKNIVDDPQFKARFPLFTVDQLGAEQLPLLGKDEVADAILDRIRAIRVGQRRPSIKAQGRSKPRARGSRHR